MFVMPEHLLPLCWSAACFSQLESSAHRASVGHKLLTALSAKDDPQGLKQPETAPVPREGQPGSQSDGMQLGEVPASQQTPNAQLADMDLGTSHSGLCFPSTLNPKP